MFEIDQQAVIDFKTATLSKLGAKPSAEHRPVAVDLRDDWPAALRANRFDETQPTAWSAEGLLAYLPPDAQDRLFDEITALTASGSRLATEYGIISLPTMFLVDGQGKVVNRSLRTASEVERQLEKLLSQRQPGVALGDR